MGLTLTLDTYPRKARTTMPPTSSVEAMTIDATLATELRTAGRKVAEWTERRDELITRAVDEGTALRTVAELVGLSHTAVSFIAKGRPER
jgi:hypothetical protein